MLDAPYARQRTPSGPRPDYIPPRTTRRDETMAIGVPEVRQAPQKGPRSRDELARDLHCGRADISKQIYSLIRAGEAIEEGDIVMLASQPRKTVESMDDTTHAAKIDSRAVSGAGMGINEEEGRNRKPLDSLLIGELSRREGRLPANVPEPFRLQNEKGSEGYQDMLKEMEREHTKNDSKMSFTMPPTDREPVPGWFNPRLECTRAVDVEAERLRVAEFIEKELRDKLGCNSAQMPPDAGSRDQEIPTLHAGPNINPDPSWRLRDALETLMAELPALLEDREKLRKLREVLG